MVNNKAISIIIDWLKTVGLEIAEHKMEAVLISSGVQIGKPPYSIKRRAKIPLDYN